MNHRDHKKVPFYQVDAFSGEPFHGNPAAICIMPCDLEDSLYQSIAWEMNLSETAFVEKMDIEGEYRLRWFTPMREVPLCGHATLAAAHVLFYHTGFDGDAVTFHTMSGALYAEKVSDEIRMNFPRNDPFKVGPQEVLNTMGLSSWIDVQYSDTNQKLLVHLESEEDVKNIQPNFTAMLDTENSLDWRGVIVTAKGSEPYDFISRYFAPWMGVNEDPVTGSAHTVLAPYWSKLLKKQEMLAYQASKRGGELLLWLTEKRVHITGEAVTVIEGSMKY